MRKYLTITAMAAAMTSGATVLASPSMAAIRLLGDGPQIELRDLAARVVVTPEDRSDIDIRVRYGKAQVPTLMVSHRGDTTVLNGHISDRSHGFSLRVNLENDTNGTVYIGGLGKLNIQDLPLVLVRVPMHASVKDSAFVMGRIGPAQSVDLITNGSGNWAVDPVNGPLSIINSGDGEIHVARAGDAIVDNMGSGAITLDGVGNLKASLTGSGDFIVGRSGVTDLQNQGSGDMTLGNVAALRAELSGSGDMTVGAVGNAFTLVNNGSSDVNVTRVSGPVTLNLAGSGDVSIEGGQAASFRIQGSGSGDVDFGGVAGAVSIDSNGSGDVSILKATGAVVTKVVGSGDMRIGH
jgi:hypothetical protein